MSSVYLINEIMSLILEEYKESDEQYVDDIITQSDDILDLLSSDDVDLDKNDMLKVKVKVLPNNPKTNQPTKTIHLKVHRDSNLNTKNPFLDLPDDEKDSSDTQSVKNNSILNSKMNPIPRNSTLSGDLDFQNVPTEPEDLISTMPPDMKISEDEKSTKTISVKLKPESDTKEINVKLKPEPSEEKEINVKLKSDEKVKNLKIKLNTNQKTKKIKLKMAKEDQKDIGNDDVQSGDKQTDRAAKNIIDSEDPNLQIATSIKLLMQTKKGIEKLISFIPKDSELIKTRDVIQDLLTKLTEDYESLLQDPEKAKLVVVKVYELIGSLKNYLKSKTEELAHQTKKTENPDDKPLEKIEKIAKEKEKTNSSNESKKQENKETESDKK